jgi:MFS family permease
MSAGGVPASTTATDASGHPPAALAWWLVAVLTLTALVSYTDRLILSVLVDDLRGGLGLSDSAVGLLQGPAFTLVYVFASLACGRLADRGRRKALLFAGVLLWCGATVLSGLAPNATTFLAGRLLLGIGEATLIPSAVSMIMDGFPAPRRGLPLGVFVFATVVGGPMGITVGGVLLAAAKSGTFAALPFIGDLAPWRFVLVGVGLAGLAAPLLLLTTVEPALGRVEAVGIGAAVDHFIADWRRLLPLYGGMALLSIGDYGLVSWVPTALSRRYAWGSDSVGVAFGIVTAAAGVAGALAGGWFADVAHRWRGAHARMTLSVAAAAVAAAATLAVSAGGAWLVLVGLGAWVLASTIGAMGAITSIQGIIPGHLRGTSMALITFSNTLVGLGCGPTLIALVTDRVYGEPVKVDLAITTAVLPAALLAGSAFLLARRHLRTASAGAGALRRPTPRARSGRSCRRGSWRCAPGNGHAAPACARAGAAGPVRAGRPRRGRCRVLRPVPRCPWRGARRSAGRGSRGTPRGCRRR